ncbi:MAG TPA: PqqD family protein [Sphingomicrobium sp.]|nr:PqqD family protein [Sphingomicrobium sp.]
MTKYRRAVELLEAELGDELVALEPNAGECFGFNTVATSVWRQLAQPKSFAELRDALLEEYDVKPEQCTRELKELLDDLASRGLVSAAD